MTIPLAESLAALSYREIIKLGYPLAESLAALSYREREIIKLRYGMGDDYSYTLEEVGHIFKVTRERIRHIEAAALRKIRRPIGTQISAGENQG
jgi:RNA polymerase primary sigma factor